MPRKVRPLKIAKITIIALLSLLLLAVMVTYFFFKSTIPLWEGMLTTGGVAETLEINRNPHGVPAIKANSAGDLMFAIGFVHAQDRLFQMDLQRRAAYGRLSEVLGDRVLDLDVWQHYLQAGAGIERSFRALKPNLKRLLEQYCRGVNYFLSSQSLPPEFHVLRYAPEQWQLRDVVATMKYLEEELSYSGGELFHARLLAALAPGQARRWPVAPRPDEAGRRATWARVLAEPPLARRLAVEAEVERLSASGGAWAVAGSRTWSGIPCLANDFSWPPRLPALFYQLSGKCSALEISGNTLPGVPFIFSGRNWQIGWGLVPAQSDSLDYFILERHPGNGKLYRCDGQWLALEYQEKRIHCRGRRDVVLKMAVSRFGPVIEAGGELIAVCSLIQHRSEALEALCGMNMARNQKEFALAMLRFTAPALRIAFADRKGNIGACQVGLVPLRGKGDGQLPLRTHELSDLWQGFAESSREKFMANPAKGWLCTADLDLVGKASPVFFKFAPSPDFQSQRLADALAGSWKLDVASAARLQNDVHVPSAEFLIGLIRDLPLASEEARHVRTALEAWDLNAGDGEGPAFFYEFERRLAAAVFASAFNDPALACGIPTKLLYPVLKSPGMLKRDELVAAVEKSLRGTYESYRERIRRQDDGWHWEVLHTASFRNPLGTVFPLRPLFERGPFGVRGGECCLLGGDFAADGQFPVIRLAAYKMVLDLSDFSNSLLIYPGGQSGHPLSPAYDDQLGMFLSLKYLKMEGVGRRLYTLRLLPQADAAKR
jgi:penicillin amidase